MNKQSVLILLCVCLFLIPLLGLVADYAIQSKYEAEYVELISEALSIPKQQVIDSGVTFDVFCTQSKGEFADMCALNDETRAYQAACIFGLLIGIAIIGCIMLSQLFAKGSQKRLALIFSPLTRISIFLLALSTLIQMGILVYGIYDLEAVFTGYIQPKLLAFLGLAGIGVVFMLIKNSFSLLKDFKTTVIGTAVYPADQPQLFELVSELCQKIGVKMPQNIVLGLEPSVFVTAADINLVGKNSKQLTKTSLYLSLPLIQLLAPNELKAVIGHELAHFKGDDTTYSLKFVPAYHRLEKTLEEAHRTLETSGLFSLPALCLASYIYLKFSIIEKKISRDRELIADREGAMITSPLSQAIALLKISLYVPVWQSLKEHNTQQLKAGKYTNSLNRLYFLMAEDLFNSLNYEEVKTTLLGSHIPHPTDTHPSLKARLMSLEIDLNDINQELLKPIDTASSCTIISNVEKVDEALSMVENQITIALNQIPIEQNKGA